MGFPKMHVPRTIVWASGIKSSPAAEWRFKFPSSSRGGPEYP
jgi:hypothetical protein